MRLDNRMIKIILFILQSCPFACLLCRSRHQVRFFFSEFNFLAFLKIIIIRGKEAWCFSRGETTSIGGGQE
jgi:hypothetical protein